MTAYEIGVRLVGSEMCIRDSFIGDEFDTNVEIVENGVHYMIDVVNGQKTGFFLDQKYNLSLIHI